jgi:hypothetical protein
VGVDRRRRGHAVQPRAQVVGVGQLRVRAEGTQQRVLHDVLGVLIPGHAPGVGEQLVAVGLDEGPEGGELHMC